MERVAGGSTQGIQVQYVGDPELAASMPYRIAIEQLPIVTEGQVSMSIAANFYTLMNVVPDGSVAELDVRSIELAEDGNTWQLLIENTGNRFARLSKTDWTVESGGKKLVIRRSDIANLTGANLILPNSSRAVPFSPPDGFSSDDVTISIDTSP